MLLWYTFSARDNANGGARLTKLGPAFLWLRRLDTLEALPLPKITEVDGGVYRFAFDAAASGDAVGQIDLLAGSGADRGGLGALSEGDRYVDVSVSRESGVILSGGPPKPLPAPTVTTV